MSDLGPGGPASCHGSVPPARVPDAAPVRGEKGMGVVLGSPMGAPGGGRRDAHASSSSPLGHIWGPGGLRLSLRVPHPLPPTSARRRSRAALSICRPVPRREQSSAFALGAGTASSRGREGTASPRGAWEAAGCVAAGCEQPDLCVCERAAARPARGGVGGAGLCWELRRGKRGGEKAGRPPPCPHRLPPPAGSAMEESAEWGTLSPEEFAQLQKYLDCELGGGEAARVRGCGCTLCVALCVCVAGVLHAWGGRAHVCTAMEPWARKANVCVPVGAPCTHVCMHARCALPEHPCPRLCPQTAAGRCRTCCRSSMVTGCCPSTFRER